jgi:radical SAM protein with 4Fe4S-binding SPASM domain
MDLQAAGSRPVRKHCDICVTGLHCVVDSLGDIYECIDDAGHRDRRIATLAGGQVEYFDIGEDHEKPHLHDKLECLKCSIALYCGGGCVNRLKAQSDSLPDSFCLQVKEFVGLTLKSYFLLKKNIGDQKGR